MADLRRLPKVDALAASPALAGFSARVRADAARQAIAELRAQANGNGKLDVSKAEDLALEAALRLASSPLRPVLNASGIVLHTGLGRARLPQAAVERLSEVATSHATVEFDLESGARGDRQSIVRSLLEELTGAEDAHVVNNGAAAILLALAALCRGREVVLSRGEMVEIGGSFRMPEVIAESGCRLVEVGCTNKTRLTDYRSAIGEETAAILRCHPSNYRIQGFTSSPSDAELAALAKEHGLRFVYDLGNGSLWDLLEFGLPKEAFLIPAVKGGADLVTASGDKLLGGPQAGLILGSSEAVNQVRRHPLARALRVDKLTLAALEATLRLHRNGEREAIPTFRYLTRRPEDLRREARRLARAYPGESVVEEGLSEVGGGSAPGFGLPTWRVGLIHPDPDALAQALRRSDPPLIGRIERGRVWLDPRTLEPAEVRLAVRILSALVLP